MKKITFAFILFTLIAIFITYPLIFHLHNYILGKGDELLITWILNWNIYAFLNHPFKIFDANIFYPYKNTLSFSDPFFTSALIAFIPSLIGKEPAIAYNFSLLFSISMLGFFTFILTYYLTKEYFSSIISGVLIAFSPFILGRMFQIQVISIYFIPLGILFFLRFLDQKKNRWFFLACLFFILQTANSFLPGYFMFFSYVIIIFYYFLNKATKLRALLKKEVFIISFATGLIILILAWPYLQTSTQFNYVRDIRDAIHFANRPEYFLYPNDKTRLQQFLLKTFYSQDKGPYRYDGYWGLFFLFLTFYALIYRYILIKKKFHKLFDVFSLIALFSFILSLGPALQWGGEVIKKPTIIPLPYAIFYYLMPGFKGLRNSARWEVFTLWALSIIIGITLAQLFRKKKNITKFFLTLIIISAILLEINFPFSYQKIPTINNFPPVYHFLKQLPQDSTIIEMPIFTYGMLPYSLREFEREYYSTLHFKKIVNGYSGFSPPQWEKQVVELLKEFPSEKTINILKQIKVNYILIHYEDYDLLNKKSFKIGGLKIKNNERMKIELQKFKNIKLIKTFKNDWIYRLEH